MHRLIPILLAVAVAWGGCRAAQRAEDAPPPEDIVSGAGTVRYVDLEGGFYGIVADDGVRYLPDSLDEAFREDGVRVRFRLQLREDAVTAQMWGTPVTVVDIMRMEE